MPMFEVNVRCILTGDDKSLQALSLNPDWGQYDYDAKDPEAATLRMDTRVTVAAGSAAEAINLAKGSAPEIGVLFNDTIAVSIWVDEAIDVRPIIEVGQVYWCRDTLKKFSVLEPLAPASDGGKTYFYLIHLEGDASKVRLVSEKKILNEFAPTYGEAVRAKFKALQQSVAVFGEVYREYLTEPLGEE